MAMGGGPPLHRRPRGAGAAETTSWAVGGAPHMSPTPIWLVKTFVHVTVTPYDPWRLCREAAYHVLHLTMTCHAFQDRLAPRVDYQRPKCGFSVSSLCIMNVMYYQ